MGRGILVNTDQGSESESQSWGDTQPPADSHWGVAETPSQEPGHSGQLSPGSPVCLGWRAGSGFISSTPRTEVRVGRS